MSSRTVIHLAICSVLFLLTLPWLWEAATCGFCTYSRYVAPWVIIANLIAATYGVQASVWRILKRP